MEAEEAMRPALKRAAEGGGGGDDPAPAAKKPKLLAEDVDPESNKKTKQLLSLEAGNELDQPGTHDHFISIPGEPLDAKLSDENKKIADGAGTKKRKELHGTASISALSGAWVHQKADAVLHGYRLKFTCNKDEPKYSSFILLLNAELDKDVASADIDLYLVDKTVKAFVSPCGPVHLKAEQVEQAKHFHELFFNGVFGKLFKGSKKSDVPRQFLLTEDNNSLWSHSYMYMLLPLESPCFENEDNARINWKGIYACVSTVELLRRGIVHSEDDPFLVSDGSATGNCSGQDVLLLADKAVHLESLKHMIVVAIHTGKIYYVVDIVAGLSADSPFVSTEFTSFSEYFVKRYGIVLQHPGQPLLLLKQSHNPHNLLSSKFLYIGDSVSTNAKSANNYVKREPSVVHMPPELLIHIDMPLDVLKSLYLLPSVMHRMESLMLASQLRKEIAFHPSDPCIPSALILEAITTLRCCEDFSLERLEHLGDSVLKYAVSCYVYLTFSEKQEGQLSSWRSNTVCNAMLHKLGFRRKLPSYIRDATFDPRRWVAPGQLTNRPFPCNCQIPEKPSELLHTTNEKFIIIGKPCDDGHRWLCSKTISDCVEALIGAYYIGGGLSGATAVMKWLGINVEMGSELPIKPISSLTSISKFDDIKSLERKLGYEFTNKDLLLQAVTHGSQQETGYCYERLEFLGDAALDLLITGHLFNSYKDIDPGELSDLRSASISNESYARCAVKHKFQDHLQHSSGLLLGSIEEYAARLDQAIKDEYMPSSKGPKVLSDMVESIAGAMLVDTGFNLDKVWEKFKPLLSVATPASLELSPFRELSELLSSHGYVLKSNCIMEGDMAGAHLSVQLESVYLVREGRARTKKDAKGQAAFLLLKDLEKHDIACSCGLSKPMNNEEKSEGNSCFSTDGDIKVLPGDREMVEPQKPSDPNSKDSVILSVKMKKGGPRTALNELCQKLQWPLPHFESLEEKISAETTNVSAEEKNRPNKFVSNITMHIPDSPSITLRGELHPDKKSSQDSAALVMLHELERQGRCILNVLMVA